MSEKTDIEFYLVFSANVVVSVTYATPVYLPRTIYFANSAVQTSKQFDYQWICVLLCC